MYFYRVDKRRFDKNDIITPCTTFEETMKGFQLEVENSLNELRPSVVPARKECLYLFCNISSALIFCSKFGGYIYAVSVKNEDIYWRADMNMLDNIHDVFKITDCGDVRTAVVRRYWEEGVHTFQPCYELLVRQAKVNRVILGNEDAKDWIKTEIRKYGTIEHTLIFNSILKNENDESKTD